MGTPLAEMPDSPRALEAVAKIWLLRMVERTALADVPDLPMDWIARQAPALVEDIVAALESKRAGAGIAPEAQARVVELAGGRLDAGQLARELGTLQAVIVEDLHGRSSEPQEFARRAARLAELFGALQAALTEAAVGRGEFEGPTDELTGLPGAERLEESLRDLEAEHRLGGEPFSLLRIDVDGLGHVNTAHGREAGDRVLIELADALRGLDEHAARAFRLARDEFCVLLPGADARAARRTALRLATRLDDALAGARRPVGVSVGVAACPDHADNADALLEAADEAAYAALAAGRPVAMAGE